MRDRDNSKDESDPVPDAYWASLAKKLLHPIQIELIEAMGCSNRPLTPSDLAEIVEGPGAAEIIHQLRRLRTINAVAYAEKPTLANVFDMPLRLVLPDDER